ncbi:CGNR zinc finger domain-containing protein [Streptomyces sp. NPDC049837]|uniref:CGNR zinc finger domain-containing protein n=1 Tax=Streptomyces sp. NPDC049837 TaxID=3155277 RepID=UPI003413033D
MKRTPDTTGTGPTARPTHAGVALVGGHTVLDFTNTVAWRTDPARRVARVEGVEAWIRWAGRVGLFTAQEATALLDLASRNERHDGNARNDGTERNDGDARNDGSEREASPRTSYELTALETLRSALWDVLDALIDNGPLPSAPWEILRRSIVTARREAALPPELPLRWRVRATGFADLAHALALQADELLASPLVKRIRRCEGPGCGWFFLDRSRSGTRRWCSSSDCGNRDRARRHYHRSRP